MQHYSRPLAPVNGDILPTKENEKTAKEATAYAPHKRGIWLLLYMDYMDLK